MTAAELRELDVEIAVKVMGWTDVDTDGVSTYGTPPRDGKEYSGAGGGHYHVPRYSTDIAAAWVLWERIDFGSKRLHEVGGVWYAIVSGDRWGPRGHMGLNNDECQVRADTAPLAICRAALKAKASEPNDAK